METQQTKIALANYVIQSTQAVRDVDPDTLIPENGGSGCLIQYRDRIFFITVQTASDPSGKNIALETGVINDFGISIYRIPDLIFTDAPDSETAWLKSLRLGFTEIGHANEIGAAAMMSGQVTTKTIYSSLSYEPTQEEIYLFYGSTRDQNNLLVSGIKYEGHAGQFVQFRLDKSTLESLDYDAVMGAPIFSETGEPVAFFAQADVEHGMFYGFSANLLRKHLDDYVESNPVIDEKNFPMAGADPEEEVAIVGDRGIDDLEDDLGLESFPAQPNYITYTVLYGTNRKPDLKSKTFTYGGERDFKLHLGYCNISIPPKHETGKIERPSWFRSLLFDESPEKHFTILANEKTEEEKFLEILKQKIGQSDEKDVLLFIHGFNVAFDEAMMRAAQLGFDLNFKGAVTAYSWPSLGSVTGYIADTDSARLSSDYLSAYIKLLITPETQKVYILAHSMGNVVLTQALLQLKNEGIFPNTVINQIILAAPDLDKDIFLNQILPAIKGAKLTLYASDKDNALLASKKIRQGYIRLGEGGDNIVVVDGIDSIDASQVDTSLLGHGYFSDTRSLLDDIHLVLLGMSPDKRVLDAKSKLIDGISKGYWVFRNA